MARSRRRASASARSKTVPPDAATPEPTIDLDERDQRIWYMDLAGYSSREIGGVVGLSHVHVLRILAELRKVESPLWPKEDVRSTSHARLLRLLKALEPGIKANDPAAIKEARMIDESIRKMYGADGPLEIQVTDMSPTDLAIQDLVSAAKARAAAQKAQIAGD